MQTGNRKKQQHTLSNNYLTLGYGDILTLLKNQRFWWEQSLVISEPINFQNILISKISSS